MSNRPRSMSPAAVIATMILSMFAGGALLTVIIWLLLVGSLSTLAIAGLGSAAALGFVAVTIAASRVIRAFVVRSGGGDDSDEDGRHGDRDRPDPRPPSDEPDWWPAFERELWAYIAAHERVPVAG